MTIAVRTGADALPLVMFDTNVIFDFFLGRDPEVLLLAQLSRQQIEIRVPEFVLMEFRGSVLRDLGSKEQTLSSVRRLATELDRADHWMSGVDSLRADLPRRRWCRCHCNRGGRTRSSQRRLQPLV